MRWIKIVVQDFFFARERLESSLCRNFRILDMLVRLEVFLVVGEGYVSICSPKELIKVRFEGFGGDIPRCLCPVHAFVTS